MLLNCLYRYMLITCKLKNAVLNHIWNMRYDMQLLDTYNCKSLLEIITYILALCYVDYPGVLCFFWSGLLLPKFECQWHIDTIDLDWNCIPKIYYFSFLFFLNICPFFFVFIFHAVVLILAVAILPLEAK